MYQENLAGEARAWIARDAVGQCVGASALFPKRFTFRNRPVAAAIAGDLVVDRAHRGFGPALAMQRALLAYASQASVEFVYGFPSPSALPVLQRAGFGLRGHVVRWIKTTSATALFRRIRSARKYLRDPHQAVRSAVQLARATRQRQPAGAFLFERAQPPFDGVDEPGSEWGWSDTLVPERGSRFLGWRFSRSPHHTYVVDVLRCAASRRVLGYAVWRLRDRVKVVSDLQVSRSDAHVLDVLLAHLVRSSRLEGIDVISLTCVASGAVSSTLTRWGFVPREQTTMVIALTAPTPGIGEALQHGHWSLFEADNDI
jgi:hypothetical protein